MADPPVARSSIAVAVEIGQRRRVEGPRSRGRTRRAESSVAVAEQHDDVAVLGNRLPDVATRSNLPSAFRSPAAMADDHSNSCRGGGGHERAVALAEQDD